MGIVVWIVVGALIGWLASALTGKPQIWIANVIAGIIGALIGGAVVSFFGNSGVLDFNLQSLAAAGVGAIVVIINVRVLRGRRRARK